MLVSNNKVLKINNKWLNGHGSSPVPPGPGPGPSLPPYTIRLKYKQGTTPTFRYGTGVLYDAEQNIWDLTYENTEWITLLRNHTDLIEVLGANASNVVDMDYMFDGCSSLTTVSSFDISNVSLMHYMFKGCSNLTTVPLFNTSSVTEMDHLFDGCSSLTSVPLFDTSNLTSMGWMFINCTNLSSIPLFNTSSLTYMGYAFYNCYKVQSGALALYQQASSQANPPSHSDTFTNCGRDTTTGAAELAQIPDDWK